MKRTSIWTVIFVFFALHLIVFTPDLFALQGSSRVVNPIYQDRYEDGFSQPQQTAEKRLATTVTCTSYAAFKSALHAAMTNRETNVSLRLQYSFAFADVGSILEQAIDEIEMSDDYLWFSWQDYKANWQGYDNDVTITFVFQYDTTVAQELEITNRVNQILLTIISVGMNDEEKAKAIHDWVVLNVAYDMSYERHSIYNALIEGLAVCEGYALLMFKMLDSCGIPVRIVSGTGSGEAHAWNLVYLCAAWFHVDATWDDPVPDVPSRVLWDYYNLSDNQIAADHVWDRVVYSGQVASTVYVEGICGNQNPGYIMTYYIPYLSTDDFTVRWTGMAMANPDQQSCNVQVSYNSHSGILLDRENKTIPAFGQSVFIAPTPSGTEGWIKIEATTNLDGLALIGQATPSTMYDMDMKASLHTRFLLSHLAADTSVWQSIVMACNPNNTAATLTYSYYNQAGQLIATKPSSIPANGSVQDNLYNLFGQNLAGSMVIDSTQPITAFMLYDSLTTAWKAGLSALPLD